MPLNLEGKKALVEEVSAVAGKALSVVADFHQPGSRTYIFDMKTCNRFNRR